MRDELIKNISDLNTFFSQLVKDKKFKSLLEYLLAVGNYLNGIGAKGNF
jgi:hypothetical protein